VLERFADNHGDKRVDNLRPRHVQAMVDAKGPNAARHFLIAVRLLMDFAISIGWCTENPTKGVTRAQIKTPGYATWAEEDIEAFYAAYSIGTRERLALELLLWTGQRRGDVVRMGRQLIRGGVMQMRDRFYSGSATPTGRNRCTARQQHDILGHGIRKAIHC
jgi:site-specific recombinase XerD